MSFPKRWLGKLFHSLMILMKKEYLKAFTFADFMRILNKLLDEQMSDNFNSRDKHDCFKYLLLAKLIVKFLL